MEAIKKQEKSLRDSLLMKTTDLLNHLLLYIPTSTVLFVNEMPVKVICGSDGKKSLLINNRPLSSADDCEWVIENFNDLSHAVDDLINPEADEILKTIEKTESLIQRIEELTPIRPPEKQN